MKILQIVLLSLIFFPTAVLAEGKFPKSIDRCFDRNITKLLTIDSENRNELKKLFLQTIDTDLLGKRAYGGRNWVNFSDQEKEIALDIYFNLLFKKGNSLTEGMRDAQNTRIKKRLANRPVVRPGSGQYHVVLKITLDNGRSISAAVLVTKQCKVFDFGQGGFASRFVDVNDVDMVIRRVRKTHNY